MSIIALHFSLACFSCPTTTRAVLLWVCPCCGKERARVDCGRRGSGCCDCSAKDTSSAALAPSDAEAAALAGGRATTRCAQGESLVRRWRHAHTHEATYGRCRDSCVQMLDAVCGSRQGAKVCPGLLDTAGHRLSPLRGGVEEKLELRQSGDGVGRGWIRVGWTTRRRLELTRAGADRHQTI